MGGGFGSKFQARPLGHRLRATREEVRPSGKDDARTRSRADGRGHAAFAVRQSESRRRQGRHAHGVVLRIVGHCRSAGIEPGGDPLRFSNSESHEKHTPVLTNVGPARAWRAPNHPQCALVTMGALDDLAAKLNMDPLEFILKNFSLVLAELLHGDRGRGRARHFLWPASITEELNKAAELMDWKKKWHPRGDKTPGTVKSGVGLSIHTWPAADTRAIATARSIPMARYRFRWPRRFGGWYANHHRHCCGRNVRTASRTASP